MRRSITLTLALILALVCQQVGCAAPGLADDWTVDRVVMLMRHGVRSPDVQPPLPPEVEPAAWPEWDVPAGWLTAHGADAIRLVAAADARRFAAQGVLSDTGCPAPGAVALVADSLQRTIVTGDSYLSALAPTCPIVAEHAQQGIPDPLFSSYRDAGITAAAARQAVDDALGPAGIPGLAQQARPGLDVVDRILCGTAERGGTAEPRCGLTYVPTRIDIAPSGGKMPRATGALGYGATAAQVFMLEYADGKPMSEVGWGRATPDDLRTAGMLHAIEFSVVARPRPLAVANAGQIVARMVNALAGGPPLTVLVGHDTEIANVGGLLDVHWSVPGFAADDPAPGGALVFEVLRNRNDAKMIRSFYRAQTLDQIRTLSAEDPTWVRLTPPGCGDNPLCPLDTFTNLLSN
ncbi:MAG: hypothetical protein KDB71_14895 [Mycobacterium sp.]|nr:hypothetical protein [Mycobacterium sp.]